MGKKIWKREKNGSVNFGVGGKKKRNLSDARRGSTIVPRTAKSEDWLGASGRERGH